MAESAIVKARVPSDVKAQVAEMLDDIGLSMSDLIRMTFMRMASERRLPFDVEVPNQATRDAIADLEAGNGTTYSSVDDLFRDAGIGG